MKKDLIEEIAKNEEMVGNLYRKYAEKFNDYSDFWLHLASEEDNHAKGLRELNEQIDKEDLYVDEEKFSIVAISTFRDNVTDQIEQAEYDDINIIQALAIAKINESSLLEEDCFNIFDSDSAKMKKTFKKLNKETSEHLEMIKNKLEKLKNNRKE